MLLGPARALIAVNWKQKGRKERGRESLDRISHVVTAIPNPRQVSFATVTARRYAIWGEYLAVDGKSGSHFTVSAGVFVFLDNLTTNTIEVYSCSLSSQRIR